MFDKQKKDILAKLDKSKKGTIDKDIEKLVKKINKNKDYYTTSSCSGRIVLIERRSEKKQEQTWRFITHRKTKWNDFKKALKNLPKQDIWFKQESLILHVCCRNYEAAEKLLRIVQGFGIKRAGIITLKKRIIIEIIGTENIETIVAKQGKLVIDEDYLKLLIKEANQKLERNLKKIKKLTSYV